jgi:hypothetical protein
MELSRGGEECPEQVKKLVGQYLIYAFSLKPISPQDTGRRLQ